MQDMLIPISLSLARLRRPSGKSLAAIILISNLDAIEDQLLKNLGCTHRKRRNSPCWSLPAKLKLKKLKENHHFSLCNDHLHPVPISRREHTAQKESFINTL